MSQDISSAVQNEVCRIREMITDTKSLFPTRNINFSFYEMILREEIGRAHV